MRLLVCCRHAQSELNLEERINGDPARSVALTPLGERQATALRDQLAQLPLDVCLHTRFDRTRTTAELVLAGRDVALETEPLFDDIDVGELDGAPVDEYRAWKKAHTRDDSFPGGESLNDATRRYARAYRSLLDRAAETTLLVYHEIPLRYLVNCAAGSDELDGPVHKIPNATPYVFDEAAVERAAERMERLASGA